VQSVYSHVRFDEGVTTPMTCSMVVQRSMCMMPFSWQRPCGREVLDSCVVSRSWRKAELERLTKAMLEQQEEEKKKKDEDRFPFACLSTSPLRTQTCWYSFDAWFSDTFG
jgi:hypothetical protein